MEAIAPIEAVRDAAAKHAGLQALVLFGSRARGDAAGGSDWDFGYLARDRFDAAAFLGTLVFTLETDRVDLVDLVTASGLLRYRAARDGRLVWGDEGAFQRFWLDAVDFWCDAQPVLRPAYEAVLARL